jgi:bifunctional non-homologous end joining protein LigD
MAARAPGYDRCMAARPSVAIDLPERSVSISKPDKALFPSGVTKLDLATYYATVAEAMLPHLADRPLNLQRFPDGVDRPGIFQQQAPDHFPDWIARVTTPKEGGTVDHVVARDAATLVYLANQAVVTPHMWLSRGDRLQRPDRMVVDLDPAGGTADDVRRAALSFGALLRDELGLEPFALATGSRGFHVVVALQRRHGFDDVRAFARDVARVAVARDPGALTLEQRKAKRGGRIFVDVLRNGYGHTVVAPYAVRARASAPVATPLHWEELEDPATRPDRWSVRTLPRRLERDGDPWAAIAASPQALGAARARLAALLADAGLA